MATTARRIKSLRTGASKKDGTEKSPEAFPSTSYKLTVLLKKISSSEGLLHTLWIIDLRFWASLRPEFQTANPEAAIYAYQVSPGLRADCTRRSRVEIDSVKGAPCPRHSERQARLEVPLRCGP